MAELTCPNTQLRASTGIETDVHSLRAGNTSGSVGRNRLLESLPPKDYSFLAPHFRTVSLECGTVLHDAGAEIERVYFPRSGMVSLTALMHSGAMVQAAVIGRGGVLGSNAGLGSRYAFSTAVVRIAGDALRISGDQFHSAARKSEAIRTLAVAYNDLLLAQLQQSVACNALHTLEKRLSRWLLRAHDCMGDNIIPLTQECLGQMLGVRRTTLTLVAQALQRAGMISYRRGLIRIADRRALEHSACECYGIVNKHMQELIPT
jgi:CRP-like cAMP-binding protein